VLPTAVAEPMLRRLVPDLVVDVGANRGQFTLDVVRAVPSARVVAFEPLEQEATVFRSIFAHHDNVQLHQLALGRRVEPGTMHMSRAADSSSLLPIGPLQVSIFPGTEELRTVVVDVSTLDAMLVGESIPPKSLLKIDVQGDELEVLRGGTRVLKLFRWIYLEASFLELYIGQALAGELINYLSGLGFRLVDTSTPLRANGRTVQIDLLFECSLNQSRSLESLVKAGAEG
jgi:FkbM family methyltransferase